MSNWKGGTTWRWGKIRRRVLERDSWECQLRLKGCTHIATQVHHTRGRAVTGDDPAHLVAACRNCNLKVGDPTRAADPAPRPRTRW